MRLSEAIILGDTLKKCDPNLFISSDGSCGCAFGGALLAVGVTPAEWGKELRGPWRTTDELDCVKSRWPWLKLRHVARISSLYYAVADGKATIEDVAVYIRSVEPIEPQAATEPSEAHEAVAV